MSSTYLMQARHGSAWRWGRRFTHDPVPLVVGERVPGTEFTLTESALNELRAKCRSPKAPFVVTRADLRPDVAALSAARAQLEALQARETDVSRALAERKAELAALDEAVEQKRGEANRVADELQEAQRARDLALAEAMEAEAMAEGARSAPATSPKKRRKAK